MTISIPKSLTFYAVTLLITTAPVQAAESNGATLMLKDEVESTLAQGLTNLTNGSTVSDIVMRHINVGDENMGVSVVQRSKVSFQGRETGIAHVHLDEIYYIVAGEGTMVTGGEFVDMQTANSSLLGPMQRGEIKGGLLQKVKPGDIAIIPKSMPHGWHEMDTDTFSYIIFRGDPAKVMEVKNQQ